jgi:cytochrome P450
MKKRKFENPRHNFSRLGLWRAHNISDPVLAKRILRDTENFQKPPYIRNAMAQIMGDALLVQEGEPWQAMHKLLAGIFTPAMIRENFAPIVAQESDAMIARWREQPEIADVEAEMRELGAKIITRFLFGGAINHDDARQIVEGASEALLFRDFPKLPVIMKATGIPIDYCPSMPRTKEAAQKIDAILQPFLEKRRQLATQPDDVMGLC